MYSEDVLIPVPVQIVRHYVTAMIGDWTTAVSRKERKNRSKRDDPSKHEKMKVTADVPPQKVETPNSSPSQESNKTKKKVFITTI